MRINKKIKFTLLTEVKVNSLEQSTHNQLDVSKHQDRAHHL